MSSTLVRMKALCVRLYFCTVLKCTSFQHSKYSRFFFLSEEICNPENLFPKGVRLPHDCEMEKNIDS